jgi:hypothetical protein
MIYSDSHTLPLDCRSQPPDDRSLSAGTINILSYSYICHPIREANRTPGGQRFDGGQIARSLPGTCRKLAGSQLDDV